MYMHMYMLTQICTSGAGCRKICQCMSPRDWTKAASRAAESDVVRPHSTCAPSSCARALSSEVTTTCTVGANRDDDAGGLKRCMYVCEVPVKIDTCELGPPSLLRPRARICSVRVVTVGSATLAVTHYRAPLALGRMACARTWYATDLHHASLLAVGNRRILCRR